MADIRVRYDELMMDWIVDNPDQHRPGFKLPAEVELEMLRLRAFLNHYFPNDYPLTIEPPRDDSDDDED